MSKRVRIIVAALAVARVASAEPAASAFVVPYAPPPVVDSAHRGLTLELALGAGTSSQDTSTGGIAFAAGAWLHHDAALAFRATLIGHFSFVGGSLQYFATPSLWIGGGLGSLSERRMDDQGGFERDSGFGGFARVGYQLTGHHHGLYLTGEVQAASIGDEARGTALLAVGYQLL